MSHSQRLKVVNFFGAPGVGKSSARSGLFWLMKSLHMSVEEVTEYAKYLVLTGRHWQLREEQLYLLAKQHHKQLILRGQYEYAITDSPLALCAFYAPDDYLPAFFELTRQAQDEFDNINFYLTRDMANAPFETRGRVHDQEASAVIDVKMRAYLKRCEIPYTEISLDQTTPWKILEILAPGKAHPPLFQS